MNKKPLLTQKILKEKLHYCINSGVFTWKVNAGGGVKAGYIAGGIDTLGYHRISINDKRYRSHRLAWLYMTGEWPKQIDHINHIKDDNCWDNLREATQHENMRNTAISRNNTSGITGVYRIYNRWQASIMYKYEKIPLGRYIDKFEAICARKSAERKYGFHENHGNPK